MTIMSIIIAHNSTKDSNHPKEWVHATSSSSTQMLHEWNICLHLGQTYGKLLGKITNPMEHMGKVEVVAQ